jgi:hypothetical protein
MGLQWRIDFPNTYGASIVKGPGTYGGPDGLFELGVFKDGNLCYDTKITSDVLGHLTWDECLEICLEIQDLNERGN